MNSSVYNTLCFYPSNQDTQPLGNPRRLDKRTRCTIQVNGDSSRNLLVSQEILSHFYSSSRMISRGQQDFSSSCKLTGTSKLFSSLLRSNIIIVHQSSASSDFRSKCALHFRYDLVLSAENESQRVTIVPEIHPYPIFLQFLFCIIRMHGQALLCK
jgi:hypothetical protein